MTRIPENAVQEYPLLPLRDVVVFPHMVVPLFVGREKSIQALEAAMEGSKEILLVAQKDASTDEPGPKDVFEMGTLATVLQMLRLPDGTVKVLVEGNARATISDITEGEYLSGSAVLMDEEGLPEREQEVLVKTLMDEFEKYVKLSKKVPSEVSNALTGIEELERLADTMAAHLEMRIPEKQELLEALDIRKRVDLLLGKLDGEIDLIEVEKRIRGRVKKQMERSQREYYLNEQMKAIQKEMGNLGEGNNDFEELEQKLEEAGLPEEARKKTETELNKLKMMSPMSAEATVVRGYIDWMLAIPWKKRSRVRHDIEKAREILDRDHYGLDEVKKRILEYLAVQSRVKKVKGPVLCLVGPPGVGKTSLGQSIARATNRKYTRMALGGVRDEAEIRGHRKTYIGALPGKLLQKLSKVGVKNPLFLFDEIDKMGMDHRGDPASALLEVLDPEQNHTFNDHYLEVDYDLSDVMFVCTSNSMDIPPALLDRMEIIRIPGYTEDEKVNIALRYLLPKQIKANGLRKDELKLPEDTLRDLIRYYTREAGVRGLEREIAKICRKVVRDHVESGEKASVTLSQDMLEDYSGVKKFKYGLAEEKNEIGQVTGLAWTQVGGELLHIECALTPGKGRVVKTGSLGDVMQESIQTALTVVRSRAPGLGIADDFHEKHDLHVHVPEGATPKDGPSAGIGMCTALVSSLTKIPVRADVAMTGEITLRGRVLAIGGLKEKLLAAHRGGIKTVIIPDENVRDLKEIPENIKESLEIRPVKWIDEVLDIALAYPPEPRAEDSSPETGSGKPRDEEGDASERINTH
ncbi:MULTISPECIES: endopeptidase La [Marinobacter]|jgi:ATP-dependent Lon protease|uniref:endopeptidase La n=1 Tax=Marinobacter TaxID=2742 RepID=UPI0007D8F41A|nr:MULTISPECIES: endopeptidase La [unclassified Marinobacter]MBL3825303.1 endopeptidase La [Marinobacter sp. MC3]MBL3893809.1 endopeptidase La [Marinobacter sp. MW3]OAN90374.1 endopeptidase La [Marinobacter sp. EhN04]OAN96906.1 endopeptidase La [Marinobacter sp. EhC06]|eukprot:gnl/TRDRNA2_/TRDRNA2_177565_c4_seq27.p1 gnl/TRDRNA2_/TRDRNA2_177565_c4~~gnl/TRDRNA2_/TRDRNA2_177565_c4_seq27.p1  ORF type:complete len:806 (+),score=159.17 gnl/TRDRNA2_/TRDRNA2_177565_c4_seq27:64-2481(+)